MIPLMWGIQPLVTAHPSKDRMEDERVAPDQKYRFLSQGRGIKSCRTTQFQSLGEVDMDNGKKNWFVLK